MELQQIRPGDLTHDAVRWWELAGHDPEDLAGAWAMANHAVRLAGLVGSSWASPRGDGTHATLTWMSGQGLLDGLFVSEPVAGERPMRGVLRLWNLDLFFVEESGVPIDQISLIGKTLEEGRSWLLVAVEGQAGKPRREPRPFRPEPNHPVSTEGEAFAEISQLAQAELIRLYANTSAVLEQVSWTVTGSAPVRVWPHSFEMSVQVRLPQDDPGEQAKFIVMGLAPPGELDGAGYWYVAPWQTQPDSDVTRWKAPGMGRWMERPSELPIAVLPLEAVTSTQEPTEQHNRLATFFAEAFNECMRHLSAPA